MDARVTSKEMLDGQFRAHAEDLRLHVDVLGDGPISADVAIIGEGPGETEVRLGKPFVGGSGRLLWDTLRPYNIDRSKVYVTNVVKRQISLSRKGNERHIVLADELDKWVGMLHWELSQLPNVRTILVLGNYALQALTKVTGILKWRGSVLPGMFPNGKRGQYAITINPAYALRELKLEVVFKLDCHKFSRVVDNTFKEHHITHIINPTYSEARALLRDLNRSRNPIAYDVEVINGETACHGFSNDPHVGICINLRDLTRNRYTAEQEADILLDMQRLCDSHRIIAQNGGFDSYWVRLHDWLSIKIWFDILLAHHTLYPQLPHNLAFIVSQYTSHPFYKDEGKSWKEGGDIDEFWRYNCKDTALTYASFLRLESELRSQKLEEFFFGHVMRAQPHLVSATVHGVAVDLDVRDKINQLCAEDVAKLKAEFYRLVHEATGDDDYFPNPNSPPQLRELFFNRLKLNGRGTSTDEDNREHILKDPRTRAIDKEMLVALDKFKKEDKFYGTYAQAEVSKDGRFRCEYKQYGVANAPGRLSSAALLTGEGGNMQNQPVRARGMYIADEECCFGYFDLAQAESQVVSFRADIPKWKEQYARARKDGSFDAHRALASEMFKVPYDEVPKEDWEEVNGVYKPTIRYTAKRCRHALNYRMERFRLSEVTGLPYHTAAHAFTIYHRITPELMEWWKQEESDFKKTREVYNALGRRFRVIQRIDDEVLKSIIAYFPQSTIGDKITQVWYQAEEDDDWPDDARVAIDVHDNLVALASEKTVKTCLRILKKYAESPIWIQDVYKKRKHEPLSIPAETKISVPSSWDDTKKTFVADKNGKHRWSFLEKVQL